LVDILQRNLDFGISFCFGKKLKKQIFELFFVKKKVDLLSLLFVFGSNLA